MLNGTWLPEANRPGSPGLFHSRKATLHDRIYGNAAALLPQPALSLQAADSGIQSARVVLHQGLPFELLPAALPDLRMERRTENQLVCGKRRYRNALQARNGLGKYLPTSACVSFVENPIKIKMGIKSGDANDRAWRIVAAGSTPSSPAFHCATVGAKEAVEAINRTKAEQMREEYWRQVSPQRRPMCHSARRVRLGGHRW
jgi:hypothetical protein